MIASDRLMALGAVAVAGVGARCALGLDAASTFIRLRASVSAQGERLHLRSRRTGEPLTLALDDTLEAASSARQRLETLALAAAREALASAPGEGAGGLGMILSLARDRPAWDAAERRALTQAVALGLNDARLSRSHCQIAIGADGVLAGLRVAMDWLRAGEVGACLIGGAESCADLRFLDALEELGLLRGEQHPMGYCPGEGAAFLLLTRGSSRHSGAWIASASYADEPDPWYTGRPSLARGLTAAIAGAFEHESMRPLRTDVVYSDLNGQPWRADEWSAAYIRTADNHGEPLHIRHPADCWGDVGAASGALLASMAVLEVQHPRMRAQSALVFTAADFGPGRSAAVVLKAG